MMSNFYKNKIFINRELKAGSCFGFTFIEVVLYVGVLGILLVVISNLIFGTMNNYKTSSIKDGLASSGYQVFGFFFREVKNANSLDIANSVLSNNFGSLSLVTPFQSGGNSVGVADLYISDGRIMFKRAGETPLVLTPENIEVTKFKFVRVTPKAGLEGVRFYLDLKSKIKSEEIFSLTTFMMIRGGYFK